MNRNRLFVLFFLVAGATAGAEVFRYVGPDGTVTFSDTPSPDAERVEVSPAQAVGQPPVPSRTMKTQRSTEGDKHAGNSGFSYDRFAIVKPSQGQSIRANDGSVTVALALQPVLMPGHTIELSVSGAGGEQVYTGTSLQFKLSEVSRGEHTVSARILGGRGALVMETPAVSFYVLRVAVGGR